MAYLKVILEGEFVSFSPETSVTKTDYLLAQILVSEPIKLLGSVQLTNQQFSILISRLLADAISVKSGDAVYIEGQLLNNTLCESLNIPAGTLLVRTLHKQSAFLHNTAYSRL